MNSRRERGAALVEFAIVVPLLFILVFGAMDVGRLYFEQVSLSEAAQEGALYASFNPDDHTIVRDRVVESLNDPEITVANVAVECPGGDRVVVSVEKEVGFITPFFRPFWGDTKTLRGRVEGEVHAVGACDPTP